MSNTLFEKASPLLNGPFPALSTLLQSNIDMLNGLVAKYSSIDLSEATRMALAVIIGGGQPQSAISAAAVTIKSQFGAIEDQDANVIAQAVTSGVLAAIQVAVSAPSVMAKPVADQSGTDPGTEVTSAAA